MKGTKTTKKNYTIIYSDVNRNTRGQSGVIICIHRSLQKRIVYYKYWNERYIKTRIKITRGYLTDLGLYASSESKGELSSKFYEFLQQIVDKINKNDCKILFQFLVFYC